MKKILCLAFAVILTLSFTAFASEFTCVKTTVDGASAVGVEETSIAIEFNQEVNSVVVNVTKDGDIFNDYDFTRNVENHCVVDVVFAYDLEYGATYVIDFSDCMAAGDIALSGSKTSVTFTVEDVPVVEVISSSILYGIGDGTVSTPDVLSANDTVQGFLVNLKNNDAEEEKEVIVFCGIYDSNGTLIKVVTSGKTIAAGAEDVIGLGTIIPSVDEKYVDPITLDPVVVPVGGSNEDGKSEAKLFIWNNVTDRSPYVGAYTFKILSN